MNCTAPNCTRKAVAKSLCNKHYYQLKRGGTLEMNKRQMMALRKCSIEGCGGQHFSNDYCQMHNARFRRHGDPNYINPKCNRDGGYKKRHKIYYGQWLKDNWREQMAYRAARKKRVKEATPPWADINAIQQIYLNCPEGYHVDHIVPITGKEVRGLHVPWNLQYLPALENLKKGNKLPP